MDEENNLFKKKEKKKENKTFQEVLMAGEKWIIQMHEAERKSKTTLFGGRRA